MTYFRNGDRKNWPTYKATLIKIMSDDALKHAQANANGLTQKITSAANLTATMHAWAHQHNAQNIQKYAHNLLMSDTAQKALRIAENAATGALDGLTLGWIDEINGATSALGYGIGAYATGRENPWDAMKRGYIQGRDNRRRVLQQGLKENPVLVNTMQAVGAIASPVNHTNIFGQAPILNHLGRAVQNPVIGGSVAGLGTAEGNWQNQVSGTLFGAGNGFVSSRMVTPWSKNINYSPQNYTGGNYAHNITQPVLYKYLTDLENQIFPQYK